MGILAGVGLQLLLDNLKRSDAPTAFDVVTKAAEPEIPSAELVVTAEPSFPDLFDQPSTASSVLTLSNVGDQVAVEVTGIDFSGADASAFSTGQAFPITIASGGVADIAIDFDSGEVPGTFTATLAVQSDAPNNVPDVNLSAQYSKPGTNILTNRFRGSRGSTASLVFRRRRS